jgi:hypothetical protein
MAKSYCLKFYRTTPGDVNVPDLPITPGDRAALRSTCQQSLLSHFNNQDVPSHNRPHHARLVAPDGTVIFTLMATGHTSAEEVFPDLSR